ncbi:MAG: MOSC N-terminal beta barrel domain-containing protein [Xanthomonadales bacterium]|nr:MOSC N-terminal beta barrel domain-containing protein [Xanthomonadales bacterium]
MSPPYIEIANLTVYPVKSMKGITQESAVLTPKGLEHDRRFMVVRADGSFVTQRDMPLMALVDTGFEPGGLLMSRDGFGCIFVPFDGEVGKRIQTRVWKDECETTDQGEDVSNWLTEALESNERLRLVSMARHFVRPQGKPDKLGTDTRTLFADAAPFLVANENSLDQLNQELLSRGQQAVPMNRFRPNIVISGLPAFTEHGHSRLTGTHYALRLCYPCERCVVTTIDQSTGRKNPDWEPYKTLRDINPMPGTKKAPAFGQNAVLGSGAGQTIQLGDRLGAVGD